MCAGRRSCACPLVHTTERSVPLRDAGKSAQPADVLTLLAKPMNEINAPQRPDCVAGVGRLELRNVVAKYPFETSHRFQVIQPNSGRRDYSRSSCDGGRRSSGLVPQDALPGSGVRGDLSSGLRDCSPSPVP